MNHGIVKAIDAALRKHQQLGTREVVNLVTRYHRRFCGCPLRHSLTANIQSVLAQEVKRDGARWVRVEKGTYRTVNTAN